MIRTQSTFLGRHEMASPVYACSLKHLFRRAPSCWDRGLISTPDDLLLVVSYLLRCSLVKLSSVPFSFRFRCVFVVVDHVKAQKYCLRYLYSSFDSIYSTVSPAFEFFQFKLALIRLICNSNFTSNFFVFIYRPLPLFQTKTPALEEQVKGRMN